MTFLGRGVAEGGSIAEFNFVSDTVFDLVLGGYSDLGAASQVSALSLDMTDGYRGPVTSRVDGVTDDCAILGTECCAVTQVAGTGGLVPLAAQPGDTIVSGLAAGAYLLILGESGLPETGSVVIQIGETTVVPLPASGLVLFGALGGPALARRRRPG